MNVVAVMITCPSRVLMCAGTQGRLTQTDYPGRLIVSMDDSTLPRLQERQLLNAQRALKMGVESGEPWILFFEDDIEFNRHIYWNLKNWEVLPKVNMASLYNPTVHELERHKTWFIANPDACYGSQGYLFSRDCAAYLVEHWHEVPGMQDIKASRLAARLGPIYYHRPSLVQHLGRQSAWGGHFHYAPDYDGTWEADELPQPQEATNA